ncbi:MAG: DNA polymerase III subunit alpha [Pseudomonadales bacterium]|nr:DNA polymerase III subunit alpha [Pseudomonadales bacterium]
MAEQFVHLRLHTEYSIVDGLVRIDELVNKAAALGMPAVAITDHSNLFGLIKFYSSAMRAGLKPICGCDVLVANEDNPQRPFPLALLVRNKEGYRNLTELISRAYTDKVGHGQVIVQREWVAQHAKGLIALSGGRDGEIGRCLLDDDGDKAEQALRSWMQCFPDSFFLELHRCGREGEERYVDAAVALASAMQCPVVATNDVRFIDQDDFEAHEARVCINERRTLDDPRRSRNYTEQQYFRTAAEMEALFSDLPEAIANTRLIATCCNLDLELGKPYLPNYPIPENTTMEAFFQELSRKGLDARLRVLYPEAERAKIDYAAVVKRYDERLDFELNVINQMGFPGYFLIVMEFIQWAKDNDIPVGPGRGSGAGSIVAYALGITDLDPLKYDLLFERFLNPERVSMPDFDVDFCMDGRDRVIHHVADMYGKEAVSQIITFGTMAAKAVVRDVARVQGKSYSLADKLSKLIPFEPGMTLNKALEQEPQLQEFIDGDEDAQEIMEMAYKLEGLTRNVGKHAGGVVIAPTKLTDFSPLYCDENGEGLVTQFDKNDVETAGLVKFDFLGLRTLTIIDWAVKMINAQEFEAGSNKLDITTIPLDDVKVYELLQRGETTAVFQLESRGMKDLIKRLLPSRFEDIIALVALFRPGPLQSGMVDDFINRKHGRADVDYPHPDLEPVLSNTYGVILYQEQVMQIAQVLANYSLGGADMLRRAMGKKKPEEMAKQRGLFMEGAEKRDIDPALAGSIFDLMEKFAGYGFNKSHSAAYALVSYQTAWLKEHYPAYFMAAVLSADMQNTDKVVTLIEECRQMKLPLVVPDVNIGEFNFTVNPRREIVYGLGAIKGLGEGPVASIIAARKSGGPFRSFLDFCQRVDARTVNKRALEALIKAGALDSLQSGSKDQARATLWADIAETTKAAEQSSRNEELGVQDLFGDISPVSTPAPAANGSRPRVRPWSEQYRLASERETLGLYLSGHPIDEFLPELSRMTRDRLANLKPERESQLVAGLVVSTRTMKSKRGDTIAFVVLDDRSARLEVSVFGKEYEQFRDLLQKDSILVIDCTVSVDDFSGALRGRARHIVGLDQARALFAASLELHLHQETLLPDFPVVLTRILEAHRCTAAAPTTGATGGANTGGGGFAREQMRTPAGEENGKGRPPSSLARPAGACPVRIHYERRDSRGCLELGEEWRVLPSQELLHRLQEEFGRGRVKLSYQH